MAPAAQALASSLSISPQPTMPASVEILTNTQEFFSTKVSSLVTLILSLGPICAASVRLAVNAASSPNKAPEPMRLRTHERRFILSLDITRYLPYSRIKQNTELSCHSREYGG